MSAVNKSSNTVVLCSKFIYCNNSACKNKHWYDSCHDDRIRIFNSNQVFYKYDKNMINKEEKEALTIAILSIKKGGKRVIVI
jgi:hypothetical protein